MSTIHSLEDEIKRLQDECQHSADSRPYPGCEGAYVHIDQAREIEIALVARQEMRERIATLHKQLSTLKSAPSPVQT